MHKVSKTKKDKMNYEIETPISDEVFLSDDNNETNPCEIFIDKDNIFHAVSKKDGKVRKFEYALPFDEIEKNHKEKILEYNLGANSTGEELYAIDVFMQGEFIKEIK